MISFLITVIKIIFLLGFLILIHEGGHFLIAKLCKVKVNEFAIGFGPTIWKKQGKETKYALRLIPVGGFVSMEGEEERSETEGSFSKASIPKRIGIVAAGGLVNIVFGLLVYFVLVACMGDFVSTKAEDILYAEKTNTETIMPGDEILKVNNKRIHLTTDVEKEMQKSKGEPVKVLVKRQDEKKELTVTPQEKKIKSIGIYFGATGDNITSKIMAISPDSPAEKAGLQIDDVIYAVEGKEVNNNPYTAAQYIDSSTKEKIKITIERKGEKIEVEIKPEIISQYLLGVIFEKAENGFFSNIYYAYWDTKDFAFSIVDNLKMLFSGEVKANQLMGPIGISEIVSDTKGISDFVYILALISLSLGVTNLLPFPPLDGGKIVILLIEAIRRKPLKENIEVTIQMLGFAVLILLSIYVAYNDILRIF